MEIKELQIGNWVLWFNKPCKVDLALLNTEFTDKAISDNIQPIPLTSEILEKNGFEHYDGGYNWELNGWRIHIELGPFYFSKRIRNKRLRIEYTSMESISVHQLQQLLKLLQIDKEIEL